MPPGGFSVIFVPDTQEYADTGAAQYNAMMQWIAANKSTFNIQAVISEGDIVSHPTTAAEWTRAVAAFGYVDAANIPYLVCQGNHDFDTLTDTTRALTLFNTNFPQSTYTGKDWWSGGFFEEGHSENAYLIRTIGGVSYLFLTLEFGPRQAVIDWANALLTTHADKTVIICTHSYMYHDDTRTGTGDDYNPKASYADAHDGEDMWTELVKLHDNIILVGSGHDLTADGSAYRVDDSDGGQAVHQFLADYQLLAPAQNGFIRMVIFDPANRLMSWYTISTIGVDNRTSNQNQKTGLAY